MSLLKVMASSRLFSSFLFPSGHMAEEAKRPNSYLSLLSLPAAEGGGGRTIWENVLAGKEEEEEVVGWWAGGGRKMSCGR